MPNRRSSAQTVPTGDVGPPTGTAATVLARELWTQATRRARTPAAKAAAAESLGLQVRDGLSRWIGPDGYHVLLDRTLGLVRVAHPAIESVTSFAGDVVPLLSGKPLPVSAARDKAVIAMLATMTDLLGHTIGPQIARDLLTLACAGPSDPPRPLPGGTDD